MLPRWAREQGLDLSDEDFCSQSLSTTTSRPAGRPAVCLINRRHDHPGWGATPEPTEQWSHNLESTSMAEFADAVDQALGDAQSMYDQPGRLEHP